VWDGPSSHATWDAHLAHWSPAECGMVPAHTPPGMLTSLTGAQLSGFGTIAQVPLPSPDAPADDAAVCRYYGVLMAYGAMVKYLHTVDATTVSQLIQQRVVPVRSIFPPPSEKLAASKHEAKRHQRRQVAHCSLLAPPRS
jgi:hypothetical protein